MRSREFSIITWKKPEELKVILHCKFHLGRKLLVNGFCPECGPTLPATRTVYTHNPSAEAQATQAIKK